MALLQPGKRSFHNPSFRQNNKFMQLVALHHFHACSNNIINLRCKSSSGIPPVDHQVPHLRHVFLCLVNHHHSAITIRDIGRRYVNGVWQALSINRDVTFNPGYFLACVIAFVLSCISIFYTLGIYNATTRLRIPTIAGTDLANQFFLRLDQAGSLHHPSFRSISGNRHKHSSSLENHQAASSIGSRFLTDTRPHKKHHTNQSFQALFFYGRSPAMALSSQTVPS